MKLRTALALVPLSLAVGLLVGAPSAAAQSTGWIRWGNWSPSAPEFDIYLYSFGDPNAQTVIKHVRYADVSTYMTVATGQYTIAMRDSGTAATAPPTLSASIQVTPGTAYTIVSMGPASHLGIQVLKDKMSALPGQALVRVVQESLQQHSVTVTDGTRTLGGRLLLGTYTGYLSVSPGEQAVHGAGDSESTTEHVLLPTNTIHTLVVLDGPGGLRIDSLADAVGSQTMPVGAPAAGLGGTAPRAPGPAPMPWLVSLAGGGLLATAGVIRLWRIRSRTVRVP
jgi:Domain of unknown function (DUF4397)